MEAEGREVDICTSCGEAEATWRCVECIGRPMFCIRCCHNVHRRTPFHRVEQWTGSHWAPSWLINVGCEIHLGHNGDHCPNAGRWNRSDASMDNEEEWVDEDEDMMSPGGETDPAGNVDALRPQAGLPVLPPEDVPQVVTVVDTSGVHQLVIRPCRCKSNGNPDDIQLLNIGLFPASFRRIQTVFTLRVLDAYRLDNLVCNTTAYQYYKRLRRLTSPAFPHTIPVSHRFAEMSKTYPGAAQNRYRELIRIGRQWRNLKYRKWHGFGYVQREPQPNELALFCAACPQPHINLPEKWKEDPNQYDFVR